eukprot:48404_1
MSDTKPEETKVEHAKHNVRVSARRGNEAYVEVAKELLNAGEPHVEISGLGVAIAEAVAVVEELKHQGMVTVSKIETTRGAEDAKRSNTEKIAIHLVKSKEFDGKYKEQAPQREARKVEQEKIQAEKDVKKAEREAAKAERDAAKAAKAAEKEAEEKKDEEKKDEEKKE